MSSRQLCVFGVENLRFGIHVAEVEEVNRRYDMTRIPLASDAVAGLINLRGRIVTAIDMRQRLKLPKVEAWEPFHIVAKTRESSVSLLVDYIGDVIEVSEDAFEPPPETMREATRELIRGIYKLDQWLMLVLDLDRTMAFGAR
ncbi:MAG: chemotaxis protein CheW [Deltaproteobacteria bacterium]|nr:chemotaxis protein CheW [Deltaproteobacteria bacterium]